MLIVNYHKIETPFSLINQCRSKGNISGNAISSVLQELFVIYAYRELFTSYTVSAN